MGQVTQGAGPAGRGQLVGGAYGRPIVAQPGNRFTQPRIQPVNPPRPTPPAPVRPAPRPVPIPRPQPIPQPPQQQNPNVSIGFGPAMLTQFPPNMQGVNPSLFEPAVMPGAGMPGEPAGMFNPSPVDQTRAFNRFYQEQTAGIPGYTSVADMKYQFNQLPPEQQMAYYRGPTSNLGAAVGTASPMLNTVQSGFNPRGAVGATSGY